MDPIGIEAQKDTVFVLIIPPPEDCLQPLNPCPQVSKHVDRPHVLLINLICLPCVRPVNIERRDEPTFTYLLADPRSQPSSATPSGSQAQP